CRGERQRGGRRWAVGPRRAGDENLRPVRSHPHIGRDVRVVSRTGEPLHPLLGAIGGLVGDRRVIITRPHADAPAGHVHGRAVRAHAQRRGNIVLTPRPVVLGGPGFRPGGRVVGHGQVVVGRLLIHLGAHVNLGAVRAHPERPGRRG